MQQMILFLLATAGLTGILVRSQLFKPLREKITLWYNEEFRLRTIERKKNIVVYKASWFLHSLFGCAMCMGLWSGVMVYYTQKYLHEVVIFALVGSIVSALIISSLTVIEKK